MANDFNTVKPKNNKGMSIDFDNYHSSPILNKVESV